MNNRNTKFNHTWKEKFDWLQEVKGDVFKASCIFCRKSFSVKNRGMS